MANGVSIDLIVDPKKALAGLDAVATKSSGVADAIGGLGKTAAVGLAALSAAAIAGTVALGVAVVHAYSDYEQLAGGVQKLFGDASATVSKFAQEAATTAGLSTNQYMDTVTSFSASLIAGLHGDQEAAAQSANVAITDMADNANTFGTSIDSIQLAYQSFAKGNFTLLDNLKLGFGGSQQGMADLINTSGVLGASFKVTAENVKDVPFDKMIEAIHQVQASMNIAGTTAREAASTIAGSFAATKASLTNLVTGLGIADSDFESLVGNLATNAQNLVNNIAPVLDRLADAIPKVAPVLVSAIQQFLPAILPLATGIISALLTGIVQAAPGLVEGAIPIVLSFVTGLIELLPSIVDSGAQILVSLVTGIAAAIPNLIAVAAGTVYQLVDAIVSNLPLILSAGVQLLTALAQALVTNLPLLISSALSLVTGLVQALLANLPLLLTAALSLITGLAKGLINAIPTLIAALPGIIVGIITFLINAIPQLIQAGISLLTSLVGALPDIIQAIVDALPQIIIGIITALLTAIPQLIKAGIQLLVALVSDIPKIIIAIGAAVPRIIKGLVDAFQDPKMLAQLGQAGLALIQGLWEGIKGAGDWLFKQIGKFFKGTIDFVKSIFGIHSPSTVFAGFGDNMILGLVNGLTGRSSLVSSTMSGLSDQVKSGFGADLSVQARGTFAGQFGAGTSAVGQPTSSSTPVVNQNIYLLPEQDPRIVGRQMGRELGRSMAGATP